MDIQDHTKTKTPSGHESDGVHICHRCGWPFPNSHPSPKHKRAHKRICGTIEGYTKLIHSEPLSDDQLFHSDEEKTPNPDKTEENDRAGSHKDNVIDTFAVSDNKDQGEEVYVLSVQSDIPLEDHADSLIDDVKDHKNIYSSIRGEKNAENRSTVDTFEVKTAEKNIVKSQTSKNSESVPETVVEESVGSSSRNSVEGNWGSVSVLSTASIDAENAHSIGKSDISLDKSRLGKSYTFEDPVLVESKEEIINQKTSEIKAVTGQNSQPPKPEAKVSNETEGRKRNEDAIEKVTNWSTGEAKSSNPKQLPTMIQKDEPAEKISDHLTLGTHPVNQDPSPPKCIDDGKKVGKKTKGRVSWVPFVCCSSVNVN